MGKHSTEQLEPPATRRQLRDVERILALANHQCPDPRAGTTRVDSWGRCFWCGESPK